MFNETSQTPIITQSNLYTQTFTQNTIETGIQTENEGLLIPENIQSEKNNEILIQEGSLETARFSQHGSDIEFFNNSSGKFLRKSKKLSFESIQAFRTMSNSPSNFEDMEIDPSDTFGAFMKSMLVRITEDTNGIFLFRFLLKEYFENIKMVSYNFLFYLLVNFI